MELLVCPHIPGDEAHLYGLSDWQLGSPDADEDLLEHDIAVIERDPQARAILVGDLLDYVTRKSKGNVYHQIYPPSIQKKRAKELIAPIKDKVLAVIGGNHDEGRSEEDATPVRDICDVLGIADRYQDTEMCLKISVGEKEKNGKPAVYTLYATHGWTNSRFMGGKALNLHRLHDVVLADIYGIAHTHSIMGFPDMYHVPDLRNNNVMEIRRLYVNFGGYQKRGQYPKSKGLPGQVLGTPLIKLDGKKKLAKVEI
jgi:hypothetical protein